MNTTTKIDRADLPFLSLDEVKALLMYVVALIGIDPQVAFCAGGQLATALGHEVMEALNQIAALKIWAIRVLTRDYHPNWHVSYIGSYPDLASRNSGPYLLTIDEVLSWGDPQFWTVNNIAPEAQAAGLTYDRLVQYLQIVKAQMLWPGQHANQHNGDSEFHPDLLYELWQYVVLKGVEVWLDSYGGFFDNGKLNDTGLNALLQRFGVKVIFLGGLCTDYCDLYTVLQARELGFEVVLLVDCVRPVNVNPDDEAKAFAQMKDAGVKFVDNATLIKAVASL